MTSNNARLEAVKALEAFHSSYARLCELWGGEAYDLMEAANDTVSSEPFFVGSFDELGIDSWTVNMAHAIMEGERLKTQDIDTAVRQWLSDNEYYFSPDDYRGNPSGFYEKAVTSAAVEFPGDDFDEVVVPVIRSIVDELEAAGAFGEEVE